jgi:CheY-like chemotaxis protein
MVVWSVKKILVVDDHPDMHKVLQIQVELMGFAGITAKNGKEGVAGHRRKA